MNTSILNIPRILCLAIFALLLVQCSKDDDPPPPKTPAELILGSWSITGDNINPAYDIGTGTPISDLFPTYTACELDDIITFKVNSEGEFSEGATKCNAADPQSTPFLWTLTNNNTKLNISALAEFTIVQLDATTLKISDSFVDSGITYTETLTYTKR